MTVKDGARYYAPLKNGQIGGVSGASKCVGVIIVTPNKQVAVYHFGGTGDPSYEINRHKWPEGSLAVMCGGEKQPDSRRAYDKALDALKNPKNNITLVGVVDDLSVYVAHDGRFIAPVLLRKPTREMTHLD